MTSRSAVYRLVLLLGAAGSFINCSAVAQADATAQLQDLSSATSLHAEGVKPWHLRVSFTLNGLDGKPQDSGTADVHWAGAGDEVIEMESKNIHGALPADDAAFAAGLIRELFLVRQLIDQTTRPIPSFREAADISTTVGTRKIGSASLTCLTVYRGKQAPKAGEPADTEFCMEPSAPTLLRVSLERASVKVRNRLSTFQGKNVALDNVISYLGKILITGHVEQLEAFTPSSASSAPDTTAIREPSLVVAGRKLKGDVPSYPMMAREQHISGSVILAAIIDQTGHIKDLAPLASSDALLTASAITAVKTWTYKPYLRSGAPVEVSTTITVNYNLSY